MEEVYRVLNGIKFILKSYSVNKTYKCSCIAYEDDKAVGVISTKAEGPGKYYIGCLAVKKEYQGRGIGTSLMRYFMDGHPDWNELTLVTPKDNEANIRFYTGRFGFEIVGEEDDGAVTVLLFRLNR